VAAVTFSANRVASLLYWSSSVVGFTWAIWIVIVGKPSPSPLPLLVSALSPQAVSTPSSMTNVIARAARRFAFSFFMVFSS